MTARPDGLGAAGCCGCWHEDDGRILLERCYRIACPPHALPINGRRAYQSHLSTSPLYFTIPASIAYSVRAAPVVVFLIAIEVLDELI